MNFQTIKWTIIVSIGAYAYWKIFGKNGVLVSIGIAALILFLIYTFQNKLLYIPGSCLWMKIFLKLLILLKTTLRGISILQSIHFLLKMYKLPLQTILESEDGLSDQILQTKYLFIFTKVQELPISLFIFGIPNSISEEFI